VADVTAELHVIKTNSAGVWTLPVDRQSLRRLSRQLHQLIAGTRHVHHPSTASCTVFYGSPLDCYARIVLVKSPDLIASASAF